jgi:hypothetical protein
MVARSSSGDMLLRLQDSQESLIDLFFAILLYPIQLKGRSGGHFCYWSSAAELKSIFLEESSRLSLLAWMLRPGLRLRL